MRWLVLVVLIGCRPPARPTPPPAVHIQRTQPVIGERFVYTIDDRLHLVISDGTNQLDATEENASSAEETVEAVQDHITIQRSIRFLTFHHKALTAEAPLDAPVVGKTYHVRPDHAYGSISDAERAALDAYLRPDTGQPDLPTDLLTNRDFTRGVAWEIPADQPAPFVRGLHRGASITLIEITGSQAHFAITQTIVVGGDVPLTLQGTIVMDISSARILSIDVEGQLAKPTGKVVLAQMSSHQTFTYPR